MSGFRVRADAFHISLSKGKRTIHIADCNYPSIPFLVHVWDHLFATTVALEDVDGQQVLDFSAPALHTYRDSGLSFWFPGIVEDAAADLYTSRYRPTAGDVVWDVGAHAGATSYFLSKMIGNTGKVFAFEPDEHNFQFLLRNIELHGLRNVIPLPIALASASGRQLFSMSGTLGSGLVEHSQCPDNAVAREVEAVSFQEACTRFGVPSLVKMDMDIEGAEADVIAGALDTLQRFPVHFAIETEHRVNDQLTSVPIGRMLRQIGYRVVSDRRTGEEITWATPPALPALTASP
ncbi:MAG TPA: FkbM family methyltransferase [Acidobacteriaceae bacterium]|jgi:FkbM family methyltransferase|nr:FkbM family methyltransferase [Acidobacteriaceae bacterium]